jgi:hypothetical protein
VAGRICRMGRRTFRLGHRQKVIAELIETSLDRL